ncbi:MAG: copper resistance protein NlpE N-terminal domain-containing protein [Gemmatimonadaceae bacterium]|nr:copper resistance protein NlpE N-terminal domain-containing protein [Gemmatimonadaceae bacterium]
MRKSLVPMLLLAACGAGGEAIPPGEPLTRLAAGDTLPLITRPAGFGGVLPCADCTGIETTLILEPDGSYRLRETYVGERAPNTFVTVGRWQYLLDSVPQLRLHAGSESTRHFAVTGALTIEARDSSGAVITTDAPLALRRISPPAQLGRVARLRGEFRYFADAATFVECRSGRLFPVAGDSAFVRLQRSYLDQRLSNEASVLVEIHGALEARAGMEEGSADETLVVDSFTVIPHTSACEASRVRALVAVGDWQLVALDGDALPALDRSLQPTLRFVLSEPTMFGNAGCNRFTGRAVLRGLALQPAALAMTRRLCVDSLANARETRYAAVLTEGGWFRLEDSTLVLSQGGVERARFIRR